MPVRDLILRVGGAVSGTVLCLLLGAAVLAPPAAAAGDRDFDAAFATAPADAERMAQLVLGEDERLIDVRVAGAAGPVAVSQRPYRVRSSGLYTLVLPARHDAYTLDDLRTLAPQTFLLQRDGSYLLREHILVASGAILALAPTKPTTIKMSSGAGGFVSIVARGGKLRLLGSATAPLTFTSWDETNQVPDTTVTDGRAYILGTGQLVVRHSNFTNLGFWSGRTGGLALAGSRSPDAGLDVGSDEITNKVGSSTDNREAEVLPSGNLPEVEDSIDTVVGEVTDSTITGDAFGFFVTGASGVKIHNVTISNSLVDGLVLHRSVTNAEVEQVLVQRSGADGIVVTRGVEGALLTQVTSNGNGRDGVIVTGTPLAKGPSPSGSSTRQFGNNVLTASSAENNARTNVRIVGGTKVRLLGNSVRGGTQGILVSGGADGISLDANQVADVNGNGIQIRDSTRIEVSGNAVRRARTGVHLADSSATIEDNTVLGADLHAITLVGTVTGTALTNNALSGQGSSAIDTARLDGGSEPSMKNNDTGGWNRTVTKDGVLSTVRHPLTVTWIIVAILLVAGRITLHRRRKEQAAPRPYQDGAQKVESISAIEQDQHEALEAARARWGAPATAPNGFSMAGAPMVKPAMIRATASAHDRSGRHSAAENAAWLRNIEASN